MAKSLAVILLIIYFIGSHILRSMNCTWSVGLKNKLVAATHAGILFMYWTNHNFDIWHFQNKQKITLVQHYLFSIRYKSTCTNHVDGILGNFDTPSPLCGYFY